ncbi:hypothetical protein [Lysinibacillus endophyticus]|uniref:hypothetical protein n=1 Tax=Ureibacillus endophyticus TaxID=1978490 RepID=UPI0020A16F9C|nr:hypothetical protein [Lysinibacillus endophyticus]MCP1145789.1 hypothetical protein [Lysinibacillus endophyticus]
MEITNGVIIEDIFPYTKEVLANFKAEQIALQHEYEELETELAAIQEKIAVNVLDRETANLSDRIYLTTQHKELNYNVEVINLMFEENQQRQTQLKLQYAMLLREAIRKETTIRSKYDVNKIIDRYKSIMLNEIAGLGREMLSQYREIAPEVNYLFDDSEVHEMYPRLSQAYTTEYFRPGFENKYGKSIISRDEIDNARYGKGAN